MFRLGLALLLASAALACNKACLDLCLPYHAEKLCFEQCGCKSGPSLGPEIVTEDGRKFKVATVPANTRLNDDEYHYMGCNVNCAEVCFRFASGYNLLNCVVGHCGCNALVSEVFPPPPPPPAYPVYQPAPQQPAYQPTYQPAGPQPAYQPAYQPAAPQPAYQPAAPQPAYQPAAPQPAYQPAAPQPAYQPAAPQPAYQPAAPQPAYQPVAPQPVAAPQPAYQPVAPQPAPVAAPQPAPVAAPQPAAPQAAPQAPASSITMPFATQDGRHYEIKPMVSDSVFFQSGCAPCVDTCARLTSYDLVVRCLGFCSCQTQVSEVRAAY